MPFWCFKRACQTVAAVSYLQIWGRHPVPIPHFRVPLVEGALELLGKSLGIFSSLVLGHSEQHGGRISGWKFKIGPSCNKTLVSLDKTFVAIPIYADYPIPCLLQIGGFSVLDGIRAFFQKTSKEVSFYKYLPLKWECMFSGGSGLISAKLIMLWNCMVG